mgnify:CR=1 FL=1
MNENFILNKIIELHDNCLKKPSCNSKLIFIYKIAKSKPRKK